MADRHLTYKVFDRTGVAILIIAVNCLVGQLLVENDLSPPPPERAPALMQSGRPTYPSDASMPAICSGVNVFQNPSRPVLALLRRVQHPALSQIVDRHHVAVPLLKCLLVYSDPAHHLGLEPLQPALHSTFQGR